MLRISINSIVSKSVDVINYSQWELCFCRANWRLVLLILSVISFKLHGRWSGTTLYVQMNSGLCFWFRSVLSYDTILHSFGGVCEDFSRYNSASSRRAQRNWFEEFGVSKKYVFFRKDISYNEAVTSNAGFFRCI